MMLTGGLPTLISKIRKYTYEILLKYIAFTINLFADYINTISRRQVTYKCKLFFFFVTVNQNYKTKKIASKC